MPCPKVTTAAVISDAVAHRSGLTRLRAGDMVRGDCNNIIENLITFFANFSAAEKSL
jgi:hypothetical protein